MEKNDSHIMTWSNFINLPDYLNCPLAIFKIKSNGFVVLTEIINTKNKPMRIVEGENYITTNSLYSRNNNTYKKWLKEGLLLYVNEKSELSFKVFKETISSVDDKTLSFNKDTKTNKNPKSQNLKLYMDTLLKILKLLQRQKISIYLLLIFQIKKKRIFCLKMVLLKFL